MRNRVRLSEIINNYKTEQGENDYDKYASIPQIRSWALGIVKEISPYSRAAVRAVRIPVNTNNYTIELPTDFLKETLVGTYDENTCSVIPLGKRDSINIAGDQLLSDTGEKLLDADGIELLAEIVCTPNNTQPLDLFYDRPYLYQRFSAPNLGRQYGLGGGNNVYGYYRFNDQDNRLELDVNKNLEWIILEYVADMSMESDPLVDALMEEAIKHGVYYRAVQRGRDIPANEKERARREWFNSRRIAVAQTRSSTKEEWMQQFRKNLTKSPKY